MISSLFIPARRSSETQMRNALRVASDTETISGQVGLRNVKQRLQLLYGEQGSITVLQRTEGRILARARLSLRNTTK